MSKKDQKSKESRFAKTHECELPPAELLPTPPPFASIWLRLLYKYRYFATLSIYNKEHRQYFRSNGAYIREILRHVQTPRYQFIIHPFSNLARTRETITFFFWLAIYLFDPFVACLQSSEVSQHSDTLHPYKIIIRTANLLDLINIFFNFVVGYSIPQTKEVVLEPKRIIKHYLKTYFIVDITPCISVFLLYGRNWTPLQRYVIYIFRAIRYFRIITFFNSLNLLMKRINLNKSVRMMMCIFILTFLMLHSFSCILGGITSFRSYSKKETTKESFNYLADKNMSFKGVISKYIYFWTIIMQHFFGCDESFRTRDSSELVVLFVTIISGYMYTIIILAIVLLEFGATSISESKFDELTKQITEYMASRRVPQEIRQRVYRYYSFKFDNRYFREDIILNTLTEHLQMEVLLYSCKTLVERLQLFRTMSKPAIGTILAGLQEDIYLKGDIIVNYEIPSHKTYLILHGTCAVYLSDGRELTHYEDGDQFFQTYKIFKETNGEIKLYIAAAETCQLFTINNKALALCCRKYPEITTKLDATFKQRIKFYTLYMPLLNDTEMTGNEILQQLQRNAILDKKRKRTTKHIFDSHIPSITD